MSEANQKQKKAKIYLSVLVRARFGQIQNEKTHFPCVKFLQITRMTAFDYGVDGIDESIGQHFWSVLNFHSVLGQKLSDQLHQVVVAACNMFISTTVDKIQSA